MKKLVLGFLALCGILSVSAQQTKVLTAEKHNEYGIVYSLPTTALKIQVVARTEVKQAGPYNQYAKRYLGTTNVIAEDEVNTSIVSVRVTPVGIQNTDDKYLMQLKAGATTFVGVDENGMLLSINAQPEAPVVETVTMAVAAPTSTGDLEEYLQYVDMDFLSAQSSLKQAEMISNSMMDVRDAYLSLTRGTADNVPTDGRQMELMLNSLKAQEAAFTRAFAGTVSTREFTSEYLYVPEKNGEAVLFRLSNFEGFVEADDYSGFPVYISTEITAQGKLPKDADGIEKKLPKDAVIYAIPGSARIKIYTDRGNLYEQEFEFAQFGTTFGLNPTLFTDKKAPSFATFSPVTGGLLEIGKVTATE